jgi:hypothetical protein
MEVSGQLHVPAALPPGKNPQYPFNERVGGPHSRFRRFGEQKNLLPLMRFEPPIIHPVARSLCRMSYTRLHFFIIYHICFPLISNLYVVGRCLGVTSLRWRSIQKVLCCLQHVQWRGIKSVYTVVFHRPTVLKRLLRNVRVFSLRVKHLSSFFFVKNAG